MSGAIIGGLCMALLTASVIALWLWLDVRDAQALIRELRRGHDLDAQRAVTQQAHIAWLEGRNALLEWSLQHYITALPGSSQPRYLAEARARVELN